MSPVYATPAPDLTTSTQVTVSSAGCFHPGACPTPAPAATSNPVVPANTASFVVPEEASVIPTAPEQSQSQKATIANSLMRAPGQAGIIASALGGPPFALSPNVPSSTAAAPPLTPSPNAPSPILPAPHVPKPSVPSQNALAPNVAGSIIITVGSQSITLGSASNFVIAGQTLHPGAPDITFQGTPVSLGLSASVIVVAGSTVTLPTAASAPAITVGFQSITLNSASHYVVAGKTLTPGAPPINIQGTPVSLALSASAIVVAGSTIPLPVPVNAPVITIGDHPITANPASQYMIGSNTLIPGGTAITVSGTIISLAPSGTQVTIGSSTIPLLTGQTLVPGKPGINRPDQRSLLSLKVLGLHLHQLQWEVRYSHQIHPHSQSRAQLSQLAVLA